MADQEVAWDDANAFFSQTQEVEEEEAAAEEEGTEESDGLVEVRIRGRAIRLSPEDAAVYEDQLREFRERDGRLGGEISQLRERSARLEALVERATSPSPAQAALPELPPAKLAMDDWEEYHRRMAAYNYAVSQHQYRELEQRYVEAETQRERQSTEAARNTAWATEFYTENAHLDRPELKGVISDVYRAHQQEIDSLGNARQEDGRLLSHARLADLAEQRILSISQATRQTDTTQPPRLEGAGRPRGSSPRESKAVKPMSGYDWMRRKRAEMRGEKP